MITKEMHVTIFLPIVSLNSPSFYPAVVWELTISFEHVWFWSQVKMAGCWRQMDLTIFFLDFHPFHFFFLSSKRRDISAERHLETPQKARCLSFCFRHEWCEFDKKDSSFLSTALSLSLFLRCFRHQRTSWASAAVNHVTRITIHLMRCVSQQRSPQRSFLVTQGANSSRAHSSLSSPALLFPFPHSKLMFPSDSVSV